MNIIFSSLKENEYISIQQIHSLKIGKFTLFTGLGAGIWTTILAGVGYALGRSAGNITYLELVHRGKKMLDANLVWIILGTVLLAAAYILVSKLVMRRRA